MEQMFETLNILNFKKKNQDKFDHDKGQKSAISGRRLRWRLSTGCFAFSPVFGRKHPSRHVIFSGQNFGQKMPKIISLHDVLEPLKQALLASRDVIISSQICSSNLQKFSH